MARRPQHAPLSVLLNGRTVGVLRRDPHGAVDFTYGLEWLEWGHALPVSLSLPLREERYIGAAVLSVFDNLLPEGEPIRARLAGRVGAEGTDPFSLLSAIGRDCVGALQFLPLGETWAPQEGPSTQSLDERDVARMLRDLAVAPLGLNRDEPFRISLAGAQEKTALFRAEAGWAIPLGNTPTTHILKPQIGVTGEGVDLSASVENEYFCMRVTKALGLPTAEVEIADFDGVRALVVERFDRTRTADGRLLRRPQEDMCQALGVPAARKYQSHGGPGPVEILRLLSGSDEPRRDQLRFLKALAAFWLLGATDGHAKNFSLHLGPNGSYALAPLYDVVSLEPAVRARQLTFGRYKLSMALGDQPHYGVRDISPRHFIQTAARAYVGERDARALLAEIADSCDAALARAMDGLGADFPAAVAEGVAAGAAERLALLRQGLEA